MVETHEVVYEGKHYRQNQGESVLDALVRGGASLQFSCRKGSCHICMLHCIDGHVPDEATRALSPELKAKGYFLPCLCHDQGELSAAPPKRTDLEREGLVLEATHLEGEILRLLLEPPNQFAFDAGQSISILAPSGASRPYSIATRPDDFLLELHVRLIPGGVLSEYLRTLTVGDMVRFVGPGGGLPLSATPGPVLLIAGGTGLAPMLGVARERLRVAPKSPLTLLHVNEHPDRFYAEGTLRELEAVHSNFRHYPVLANLRSDFESAHFLDVLDRTRLDEPGAQYFVAGAPGFVERVRYELVLRGVRGSKILADSFTPAVPAPPRDSEKLARLRPDPELWAALDSGRILRAILESFYPEVFADPRLGPYFHNVTVERAIQKQFEFLRSIFAGDVEFFGARPHNAHHWMVISDELFDYREELFARHLARVGFPEHLSRRWLALHELFRAEIVKATPRGLVVGGVEHLHEGYSREILEVGSVCDGCHAELACGSVVRMHRRTGRIFCEDCDAPVTAN